MTDLDNISNKQLNWETENCLFGKLWYNKKRKLIQKGAGEDA